MLITFRLAGHANFRILKTDPLPWCTERGQENYDRTNPLAIPICCPGGVSWNSKNLNRHHRPSQWARPASAHTSAWSPIASRKRNTEPARCAVLNVGASFPIHTFNETPGENSPASSKMLQPSGCSCAPRNGFVVPSSI